jgi:protein-disulfide isomerase
MPKTSRLALASLAAVLLAPLPLPAAEPLSVPAVEQIVRDLLLREPEILEQAMEKLQSRYDAEIAAQQKAAVAQHENEIFWQTEDPVAGNAQGDVTLVQFFDYHCGYCRSIAPALREFLEKDKGLRLVFKELPILGPDSLAAAKLALAAQKLDPGRYPALHFALMGVKELSREAALAVAAQQGYDQGRLAAEMDSAWVQARIDANQALAEALGIRGTPSFVLGDKIIPGESDPGRLAMLIEEQRQARPAADMPG